MAHERWVRERGKDSFCPFVSGQVLLGMNVHSSECPGEYAGEFYYDDQKNLVLDLIRPVQKNPEEILTKFAEYLTAHHYHLCRRAKDHGEWLPCDDQALSQIMKSFVKDALGRN
jgi:hypothetical protein